MSLGRTAILCAFALSVLLGASVSGCAQEQPQQTAQSAAQQTAEPCGPNPIGLADKVGGINFAKWAKRNPDMVGWVKIKGTNVDNVVMQARDNDFYLHRGKDKESYDPGTVFMDFRNDKWLRDYNTVFYGHHMADGSMFRDIARYVDPSYLKAHSDIVYINHAGIHKLKAFYCWAGQVNDDMNRTEFANVEELRGFWKQKLKKKKLYNGVKIDDIDHIYSFYTCSYQGNDFRTVLLAAEQ